MTPINPTLRTQPVARGIAWVLVLLAPVAGCRNVGKTTVQGYRLATSLPSGSPPGSTAVPVTSGEIFVVVRASVPRAQLVPPESEYARLREIFTKYGRAGDPPRREQLRQYAADRFALVLADGTEVKGALVSGADYGAPSFTPVVVAFSEPTGSVKRDNREGVEIAFNVAAAAARPPFRLRFGEGSPAAVPE